MAEQNNLGIGQIAERPRLQSGLDCQKKRSGMIAEWEDCGAPREPSAERLRLLSGQVAEWHDGKVARLLSGHIA